MSMTMKTFLASPRVEQVQAFEMLTTLCYNNSVAGGWHHDMSSRTLRTRQQNIRLVPTRICLAHSEISEAMEGDRKRLMDDKLVHRSMLEVECADAAIRIFDLCGCLHLTLSDYIEHEGIPRVLPFNWPFKLPGDELLMVPDYLTVAHCALSQAFLAFAQGQNMVPDLYRCVATLILLSADYDLDFFGAIHQKLAYNLQRADHKLEVRQATGGKVY